ncbi:hypothetical protein DdX_11819 [Ditylenchus destructor]|uniref:Uncharacterized protein n=1 Tax=Ditylenchus destructor TaxID=166010 RepID=A0AAD4MW53_9BILA|nr:hypothetical protein DdX_11819 [Ditylenchus destructor]
MSANRAQLIFVATILIFILIIVQFSECGKGGEKHRHRKHRSSHRDSGHDSRRNSRRDEGSASKTKSTAGQSSTSADEAKKEWERIKNLLRFKKGAKFLIGVDKYDTQEQIISQDEERAMRTMMAKILPSLTRKLGRAAGNIDYKCQKASANYKAHRTYEMVRSKEFRECMIGKGSKFACKVLSTVPGETPKEVIENLVSSKGLWQKPLLKLIYYTGKGLRMMKLKRRREKVDPKDLDRAIITGALQELKQTQMSELSKLAAELEGQIGSFFDTCTSYLSDVAGSAVDAITAAFKPHVWLSRLSFGFPISKAGFDAHYGPCGQSTQLCIPRLHCMCGGSA